MLKCVKFNLNIINAWIIIVNKLVLYSVNGMNLFKNLFLIILVLPLFTYSQSTNRYVEKAKMLKFFDENIPWKTTKDSSAAHTFSFKVFVEKDLKGIAKVTSITASDSIAFQIYPKYKFLETISYDVFMGNDKAAIFIIPVGLEIISSKGEKIPRSDFFKDIMSLFHFRPEDQTQPEIFIYFKPILLRMNKQVFD